MDPHIQRAVESVLSRSRLKLDHPGDLNLHPFYADPTNFISHTAESVQSYNRLRVTANNLQLNSQSNFTVSTSSLVSSLWLHVTLQGATNNGFKLPADGWLYNAVSSIELSFSNSIISNLVITGTALRDYLLLSCKNRWDREQLLKLGGEGGSGAVVHSASIPIGHILSNASFQAGNYPMDFSVFNGPLSLQVNWQPGYRFTVFDGAGAYAPPTQWISCEITGSTIDLIDSSFAVKTAMQIDPTKIYTMPGRYLNSITYNVTTLSPLVETTINLQSAPAGMISAIILNIRPQAGLADGGATSSDWFGIAAGTALIHGESVPLNSLSLQFGGQYLVNCRSNREIRAMLTAAFEGDDLSYDIRSTAGTANLNVGEKALHAGVICIPLGYRCRQILSGTQSENLPGYSGASLQLTFSVQQQTSSVNASVFASANDAKVIQPNIPYQVSVTYIIEALVQVSQGTTDLQL